MEALELLAHPVRLRIVHAMRGGRTATTADLAGVLPDVSRAMVYRHVEQLVGGGILEVVDTRQVRGAVERRLRLREDRAGIPTEAAGALSAADHRRVFATALAVLATEFDAYLDREDADPAADLVGYRQHSLWLDRDELDELIVELRRAIAPRLANRATPGRSRYLLSPILFPGEAPGDDATTDAE